MILERAENGRADAAEDSAVAHTGGHIPASLMYCSSTSSTPWRAAGRRPGGGSATTSASTALAVSGVSRRLS